MPPRKGASFWRTGIGAGAGLALVAAGTIVPTAAANAAPGDPFDPNVPLAFVAQGIDSTQLFRMVPQGTGYVFEDEGLAADVQYNALGFNSLDNYLYAISLPVGDDVAHLLRIGSDGVIVDLGAVAGLEDVANDSGYNQGAFGDGADAGVLYVRSLTNNSIFAVDVASQTAERIQLSRAVDNLSDFASKDGYLWGVGLNNDTMFRIDPATGEVDSWVMGLGLNSVYGAQFFLGNGNLALSQNNNGNVWQVEIANATSANPTFSLAIPQPIPGPSSTNNDGASIPGQSVDLGIVKEATPTYLPGDDVADTIDYRITVTNNGPGLSSGSVVTDILPPQLLLNAQLQFPGDVCALTGADLICSIPELAANGTFVINISGQVSGDATGNITNTASVLGNEEDPTPGNNEGSATTVPVDQAPEATDDLSEGNEPGTPVTVDVLGNDDETLIPETVRLVDPETGEPATEVVVPGEGTWTVENGKVTFTPEEGFVGDPTPIDYTAEDENGTPATATVTITYVDPTPEEPTPAPEATDDASYGNVPGTPVTVDVLANDDQGLLPETVRLIDPETGELVTELVVPGEGTWTVEDGKVTFTPEEGFEGNPTPVEYSAEDENGTPARATVTIEYETVPEEPQPEEPAPSPAPEEPQPEEPAPSPAPEEPQPEEPAPSPAPEEPAAAPQASDDLVTGVTPGDSVNVRVLDNDDEGLLPESVRLIDPETGELVRELIVPGEGTWTVEDDGSITFTPEAGFTGDPTPVKYSAADEDGNRTEATVTIDYLDLAAPAKPGDSLSPTGGSIAVPLGVAGGALLLGGAVTLGLRRRTQQ